jgi:HK97 family phage prohead protease
MNGTAIRKTAGFDSITLKANEDSGVVTCWANSTNVVDKQNDLMAAGCFQAVIGNCEKTGVWPAVCVGHNVQRVVGQVTGMSELMPGDPRIKTLRPDADGMAGGLVMTAKLNMRTSDGRDTFYHLKDGDIREWSIQFYNSPQNEEMDRKGVRIVRKVDELFEVSPVLRAASPFTGTLVAKGLSGCSQAERELVEYVADTVDLLAYEQLAAREDRAYWQKQRREVATGVASKIAAELAPKLARTMVNEIAERREVEAWCAKQMGFEVWSAPVPRAPRPLTEQEKFENEIAWRAGVY